VGEVAPDLILESLDRGTISLSLQGQGGSGRFLRLYMRDLSSGGRQCSSDYSQFSDEEFAVIGVDVWDGNSRQVETFFRQPTRATFPLLLSGSKVGIGFGFGETSFR